MTEMSLIELYEQHNGKVSDKWSSYLYQYDRIFQQYRDQPIRLLEIGIQNGGSLDIWAQYFPNAESIIGCDINPKCEQLEYDDPRIKVVVGDANNDSTQALILDKCSSFDIVIDDGSHLSSDIIKSFARYFPHIHTNGMFVAEDLHCSYWHGYEGGLFDPYSSIGFFKSLADIINREHWGVLKTASGLLAGLSEKYGIDFDQATFDSAYTVELMNSMSVVRKCPEQGNRLGSRLITGTSDTAESIANVARGPVDVPSQETNYWSARDLSPAEELRQLEGEIRQLNHNNKSLRAENTALLSSLSWKITAPLRYLLGTFNKKDV